MYDIFRLSSRINKLMRTITDYPIEILESSLDKKPFAKYNGHLGNARRKAHFFQLLWFEKKKKKEDFY